MKIRVPTRVFPFYFRLKSRVPTRASNRIQRSCWNRSFLWRLEFFRTRVFHFIIIFEDPGSDSGFPFLFSFEVTGSDSSFLSDSRIVLKPIISLKIRVFQNSGFPFSHYFWRSGFRLGFSLFIFVWSLGFGLELPIGFNTRVETDRFFEDSSFSKLGFSIFSLFLKIRVPTRVFPFYFRLKSRVLTRASYRIQRSCWNRSFLWRFEFFKTRVFHFIIIFEDPSSDSGFPFLFSFEVSGSDSSFLSDSTLVLKPIVFLKIRVFQNSGFPILFSFEVSGSDSSFLSDSTLVLKPIIFLKIRVFQNSGFPFYHYFWRSGFRLGFSLFIFVWSLGFRLELPIEFNARVEIDRFFEDSCFSKLGFSILSLFFKIRVSTRVFSFYFRLKSRVLTRASYRIQRSCWNRSFPWRFEFFKTRVFHFIIIFEHPGSDSGFPFLFLFEVSGSDSRFLSDLTLVLKLIVSLKIRVFQNWGFPFYHFFEDPGSDSGFPFLFSFEVSGSDSSFLSDSTLVLKPIIFLKIRVFQNSGFPFYHYFWRSGFRLGFSLLFAFEVWGSDSSFLSDSTLVLKSIVSLKIRVFQNSGFPFYHYFWRSEFRLGFSLFIFVWSLGFWLEPPIGFNARVETDRFFEDLSFSKLGFSILSLFLKIRVPTRVFPFYFRLKSRVPTRASYRIQRSCWNRSFLWRFEFFKTRVFHFLIIFEDPGSDSGFPFLFSFEVSGSDSSFLSDSTLVLKPIVSLKIQVFQNSDFPFSHYFWRSGFRLGFSLFIFVWSLGFRLELPIGFNTRVETDRFFEDSSFSKLGFSILSLFFKIRVPTRVFPFYFRLKSRVLTRASYQIQHSCWNRSFLWRFEFFKTRVFHFIIIFEDPSSDSGFPFLFSFEVSGSDSSFLSDSTLVLKPIVSLKIQVFQTRIFHFLIIFEDPGSDSGFPFLFLFEVSGSESSVFFKTRVFHFIIIFEDPGSDSGFPFLFSFEVPGSDSSFLSDSTLVLKPIVSLKIRVFQNSGFPFYHYFWRSEFWLGFSLFIFIWSLGFWLELPIGFNARVETDRFFEDLSFSKLGFSILSLFLKIRVPTRVFPFYFRLKSRVPTRASYRIQRSCWNGSFLWRFEFFKTRVFHFIIIFEDPGSDSGFPFLFVVWSLGFRLELPIRFNARVETDRFFKDSSFSKLGFSILSLFLKIRVSDSGFPFLFAFESLGFWLELPIGFIARVEIDRFFEDSSFSKLGFSILSLVLKIRVSTRVFSFYFRLNLSGSDSSFLSDSTLVLKPIVSWKIRVFQNSGFPFYHYFWKSRFRLRFSLFIFVWSLGFRLEIPIGFNARVETRSFLWRFEFFKTGVFHFIIIFEDPGSDSGFPFLFSFESLGFRLELPIGFNARVETDHFFEDSSFSKLGFSILSLFLKIRVPTRVFPFYLRLKSGVLTRASYRIQRSCWNRSFLWRFEFFKTRVFHFLIIFEDPGSDSGFPFLFWFEVSGSDSSFLSDSTLVLKPIIFLKIRVFQNSGFPFYHYFWRSGFRLGFSLFIFVWSLGFRLELPIGFNTRVETDRFFEDSSFSKLGFSILSLFLKIRVPTRVFPFYFRLKSLGFRLELPIRFNPRVETDRFFEDSSFSKLGFSILSLFLKIRVLTRVFPFYFHLKSRVLTRASYRIQRSCWNRSFLWRFEFFKTRVFHFIIIFEDPGSDSGFPFLFSFEVSGSDSSLLSDSTLVLKPIVSLKIWVFQNSGFPFYHYFWRSGFRLGFSLFIFVWSLGFRLELPIGFNARVETDRFFEDSSFSKLGFSILSLFLKIRVPTRVFPFYFRLKSRVLTRASYRIQRSCWNRSFLWRFEFFKTRVFHFIIIFEDPGSDSGFPFLFWFEVSGSDSSFLSDSTLVLKPIIFLKIRVFQNSGFPFYHYFWRSGFRLGFSLFIFVWSLGFRLELPIRFNARVEIDRFFEYSSFSKLGFSILSLFLKIRVSTRVFSFYFRLKSRVSTRASYRIQRSCWNRSFPWRFEFFKTRVFHFIIIFEHPGSDSGFPFLFLFEVSGSDSRFLSDLTLVLKLIVSLKIRVFQNWGFPFYHYFWRSGFRLGFSLFIFVWSLGFRLELPIGFNARVETDHFFEDSSFSKLGFSILSLFLKIRVPTRVFPFYFRLKSRVLTRASYRIQRSCWNRSFLWRFEFFKTRVFHFIIIFEDPGSDSGFPFLFSFEVSGSDSSFLSDSTLVLKRIISLKIRVFQNSGFPFYHYFWRSGFRLGFSLFIFVWSLGFRLELPIRFNARVSFF